MRSKHSGKFALRPITASSNGVSYDTFLLSGWLNGRRIRRHFKDRDEALGKKNRLEVEAANKGEIRARATRLSAIQLAEAAMSRLGPQSLSLAVDWFLATYKPPVTAIALETAVEAFLEAKKPHIRPLALRDYRVTLKAFQAAFLGRQVHTLATADIQGLSGKPGRWEEAVEQPPRRFERLFCLLPDSAPRMDPRESRQADPEIPDRTRNP